MAVQYQKGANTYHATNPALASVVLVNGRKAKRAKARRSSTARLDVLKEAVRLKLIDPKRAAAARTGRSRNARGRVRRGTRPVFVAPGAAAPAAYAERYFGVKPGRKPKRANAKKKRTSAPAPKRAAARRTTVAKKSKRAKGKRRSGLTAKQRAAMLRNLKKARSALKRSAPKRRRRSASPKQIAAAKRKAHGSTKRKAAKRHGQTAKQRAASTRNLKKARSALKRKAHGSTKRKAAKRRKNPFTRSSAKRASDKRWGKVRKAKRKVAWAGLTRSQQTARKRVVRGGWHKRGRTARGRHFVQTPAQRAASLANVAKARAALHRKAVGRGLGGLGLVPATAMAANRRRGKKHRRNPGLMGAVTDVRMQALPLLQRGLGVVAGGGLSFGMDKLADQFLPGTLGRAQSPVAALAALTASFVAAPFAGAVIGRALPDLRIGMAVYAIGAIAKAFIPDLAAKIGLSGSIYESPQVRGYGEYVNLPGGGDVPGQAGLGEYVLGSYGGDEAGAAMAMVRQDPMQSADRMLAAEESMQGTMGFGINELDDETRGQHERLTQAVGEYVSIDGMGDYVSRPMEGLTQSVGAWQGGVYQGLGEDAPAQARNMIDYPPNPAAPVTASIPGAGAPVDEEYGDPLSAGGIFAGGPYC